MFAALDALTSRLYSDELDPQLVAKGMEDSHRVGAPAHAGDNGVGKTHPSVLQLGLGLDADAGLKFAHHHRVGVWAGHRSDAVKGVAHVGDPVAQGLVHGVF